MNIPNKKVWILITVDLENMNTPLLEGKYKRNLFSIETIQPLMNILERYNIKVVFFASVFECCRFGKNEICTVLKYLHSAGHDIELHTHPVWCYGKEHMWQYPLKEQINIIRHGRELINEWLGKDPIAHRAGAYGINRDTIEALRQNGFSIDSSMFFKHENCKLNWSINKIVRKHNILEIPVTGFYRQSYFNFSFFKLKYKKKFIKTDIDWCSLNELKAFINYAIKYNIKFITLFMHSYSFIMHDSRYRSFKTNENNVKKLDTFIRICLQNENIQFMTLTEFWKMYQQNQQIFSEDDHVPIISRNIDVFQKRNQEQNHGSHSNLTGQ